MPCSARVARWSGRSRRASNPPWIAGCKVLTRPASSSGAPVTVATSVTGSPASAIVRAELPVETSATPCAASPRANGTIPLLSLTEISARRIGHGPLIGESGIAATPHQRNARRYRAPPKRRQGQPLGSRTGDPDRDQLHQFVDDEAGIGHFETRRRNLGFGIAVETRAIGPGDPW